MVSEAMVSEAMRCGHVQEWPPGQRVHGPAGYALRAVGLLSDVVSERDAFVGY